MTFVFRHPELDSGPNRNVFNNVFRHSREGGNPVNENHLPVVISAHATDAPRRAGISNTYRASKHLESFSKFSPHIFFPFLLTAKVIQNCQLGSSHTTVRNKQHSLEPAGLALLKQSSVRRERSSLLLSVFEIPGEADSLRFLFFTRFLRRAEDDSRGALNVL